MELLRDRTMDRNTIGTSGNAGNRVNTPPDLENSPFPLYRRVTQIFPHDNTPPPSGYEIFALSHYGGPPPMKPLWGAYIQMQHDLAIQQNSIPHQNMLPPPYFPSQTPNMPTNNIPLPPYFPPIPPNVPPPYYPLHPPNMPVINMVPPQNYIPQQNIPIPNARPPPILLQNSNQPQYVPPQQKIP